MIAEIRGNVTYAQSTAVLQFAGESVRFFVKDAHLNQILSVTTCTMNTWVINSSKPRVVYTFSKQSCACLFAMFFLYS